jgi:hypothetical protein
MRMRRSALKNVDEMLKSDNPAIKRILGVTPGQDRARATGALVAALLGTGESQMVAQQVEIVGDRASVDPEVHGKRSCRGRTARRQERSPRAVKWRVPCVIMSGAIRTPPGRRGQTCASFANGPRPLRAARRAGRDARFIDGKSSKVLLRKHEVVVQHGNRHAWRNRSDRPAVMLFVLLGAGRGRQA